MREIPFEYRPAPIDVLWNAIANCTRPEQRIAAEVIPHRVANGKAKLVVIPVDRSARAHYSPRQKFPASGIRTIGNSRDNALYRYFVERLISDSYPMMAD